MPTVLAVLMTLDGVEEIGGGGGMSPWPRDGGEGGMVSAELRWALAPQPSKPLAAARMTAVAMVVRARARRHSENNCPCSVLHNAHDKEFTRQPLLATFDTTLQVRVRVGSIVVIDAIRKFRRNTDTAITFIQVP
jgi:hypothetical protein